MVSGGGYVRGEEDVGEEGRFVVDGFIYINIT